ncbi:type VI secretion system-associated FHA domain protein TagH [Azoarcus sp. L1K30]|uniref:type VI secretion system-associated FHA domain protein TagH n=1 Tax=Azoarcus sp. L1K30 TaxID=2820277 RepID=UPI001B8448B1|nr:type VI secretion system-associated FHA domain protein TagH [Azoarcus sp. L1K30]MBR0564813.1 type VI secretion system-associated FHA domain protein TagH [Azoarcus sp. L1K30]
MLEIVAITYNDIAPVLPIAAVLPDSGGTIGRDERNTVVLPDPMRVVSRRHLELLCAPDGMSLTNISESNAALVNDVSLAPGASCRVVIGDRVTVGCYVLEIREHRGEDTRCADGGDLIVRDSPARSVAAEYEASGRGGIGSVEAEIASLCGGTPLAAAGVTDADATADANVDAILETRSVRMSDIDPLGEAWTHGVDLVDLSGKGDALVRGIDDNALAQSLVLDPSASTARAVLSETSSDPLEIFGAVDGVDLDLADMGILQHPKPSSESHSVNHRVELSTPFVLPVSEAAAEGHWADASSASDSAAAAGVRPTAFIPDDDFLNVADVVAAPASAEAKPNGGVAGRQGAFSQDRGERLPPVGAVPPRRPQAAAPKASRVADNADTAANVNELYQALLEGLGIDALPDRHAIDPDFMRLIGQLLKATTHGTVRLMSARAAVKREVRANVTVIAPVKNNPLKFSPDGEVAMMYLLGRPYPGFMGALEAIDEAYGDLYAHQVGMVSGMRSALGHVLERFDPEAISRNANTNGLIEGLLSVGRKARLWDAYGRYFENTRELAEDRFQEFFGAAFLEAYEEVSQARASSGSNGDQGAA